MRSATVARLKSSLSEYLADVERGEEVVITKNGSPVAVLISPDLLDSLRETSHVRSDAVLMAEIKDGLKQLRSKKARLYTLEELVGD